MTASARPNETTSQPSLSLQNRRQNIGNFTSDPEQNGRDRLPENERYPNHGDQVINSIRGCKPLPLSEVARPVFVNHYYAGEPLVPVTSRRLIRLDESDISTENLAENPQPQVHNCEFVEHSRDLLKMQLQG